MPTLSCALAWQRPYHLISRQSSPIWPASLFWDFVDQPANLKARAQVYTVLIKINENEIRKISSKIREKRRKTAKFRLSSNFRTYASEISLRHCLVSLRNFGVAAKLRSKFRCRAIFRKKFRWALRNVAARHFEHSFGSALRNFERHFRDPLQSFQNE